MRIRNIIDEKENDLKRKILVIDDEQGVIDSLNVYLRKEGYIVEGEINPLLGIEKVRNNYYDILNFTLLVSLDFLEFICSKFCKFSISIVTFPLSSTCIAIYCLAVG